MTKNNYTVSEMVKDKNILKEFESILKFSRSIKTIIGDKPNGESFYNELMWNKEYLNICIDNNNKLKISDNDKSIVIENVIMNIDKNDFGVIINIEQEASKKIYYNLIF